MTPDRSLIIVGLFFGEVVVLTALTGASLGQGIFGLRVVRFVDGGAMTPLQALFQKFGRLKRAT
jgi:hypothetical protein